MPPKQGPSLPPAPQLGLVEREVRVRELHDRIAHPPAPTRPEAFSHDMARDSLQRTGWDVDRAGRGWRRVFAERHARTQAPHEAAPTPNDDSLSRDNSPTSPASDVSYSPEDVRGNVQTHASGSSDVGGSQRKQKSLADETVEHQHKKRRMAFDAASIDPVLRYEDQHDKQPAAESEGTEAEFHQAGSSVDFLEHIAETSAVTSDANEDDKVTQKANEKINNSSHSNSASSDSEGS